MLLDCSALTISQYLLSRLAAKALSHLKGFGKVFKDIIHDWMMWSCGWVRFEFLAKPEIPNALRLHTATWWRVMSSLINVWIFRLVVLSLVRFFLLQRLKLCWLHIAWIWGISSLSCLPPPYSSHVSAGSLTLVWAFFFSRFYLFSRRSFCPKGKLLLHDTKMLQITVRKVCHALYPKARFELNGYWMERDLDWERNLCSSRGIGQWWRSSWNRWSTKKKNVGGKIWKQVKEQRRKTKPIILRSEYEIEWRSRLKYALLLP